MGPGMKSLGRTASLSYPPGGMAFLWRFDAVTEKNRGLAAACAARVAERSALAILISVPLLMMITSF